MIHTPIYPIEEPKSNGEYEASAARAFSGKEPEQPMSALGAEFLGEFHKAELDRLTTEQRWLMDMRQYKGKYEPEELAAIGPTRSKSYVRKTRVKVKTVDSRVSDLLFPAGNDKNWDASPTPVADMGPEAKAEAREALIKQAQAMLANQQQMMPAEQAPADPMQAQAPMQAQGLPQGMPQPAVMGAQLPDPTDEQIDAWLTEAAKKAAKGMSKKMEDQLVEARYKQQALKVLHSGHLYGTGVLKGPLVERRIRTRFKKDGGNWTPCSETYLAPFLDFVPLWRFYPDMGATELDQCRFIYERHSFSHAQFFELTKNKSFNKKLIVDHLEANPGGVSVPRHFDAELKAIGDRESKQGDNTGQFELLERWGYVEGYKLAQTGIKVDPERMQESFFANTWMLPNGTVIKAVLQPIDGITWPYHLYHFDKDETSIFGEGLATIMRDDQKMINAATRMMLDNAAITSGPMIEIITSLLSGTDNASALAPWKVYLRNGQQPGSPAVRAIEVPNHVEWLAAMASKFDQNADEVTAIPRYMTGENATNGAAGTSSGLSMLMGAVNIVIKDLISGYDEGVTVPFLQSLYRWNMKFGTDHSIKGDFDVYARGTASLVAREVRARQLNEFATLVSNPEDAPYIKRHKLNQQRAEALELSDVIKTEDEVEEEQKDPAIQAQQQMQQDMIAAQLGEQQAKAAKLSAEAELVATKVKDMLARLEGIALDMQQAQANVEKTQSETIQNKVASVFAALQAGGVATERPVIAPAGDEILRSVGFVDKTPEPTLAMLNGPPVQSEQDASQAFGQDASELGPVEGPEDGLNADGMPLPMDGADARDDIPDVAGPDVAMAPGNPTPEPATGQLGLNAGMRTDEIEGV